MSRTLKDRPTWVLLNDPNAPHVDAHWYACNGECCTINQPLRPGGAGANPQPCRRIAPESFERTDKAAVHAGWYGPERATVRGVLGRLRQEHRGGVDVDELDDSLVPVAHPRNSPWGGGYWD